MTVYVEVKAPLHSFLTFTLHGVVWSASHTDHFNPKKRSPSNHWTGGSRGPRPSLEVLDKIHISRLYWELKHNSSVASRLSRLPLFADCSKSINYIATKNNILVLHKTCCRSFKTVKIWNAFTPTRNNTVTDAIRTCFIHVGSNKETVRVIQIAYGLQNLGVAEVFIKSYNNCTHIWIQLKIHH